MLPRKLIATFGLYTAWEGKLSKGDSRSAYVTGPCSDGKRIAPIASYYHPLTAKAGAKRFHAAKVKSQSGRVGGIDLLILLGIVGAIFYGGAARAEGCSPINVNVASVVELVVAGASVEGAARIAESRRYVGGFRSVEVVERIAPSLKGCVVLVGGEGFASE